MPKNLIWVQMLKLAEYAVVTAEVPDEIALALNLSLCPCKCEGCHSPYLARNFGQTLNDSLLNHLISINKGITCIAFMGGDNDPKAVEKLSFGVHLRSDYPYKTAWYSGREDLPEGINIGVFDYIKLGPYKKEFGPLNKRTTNQRFYKVRHNMDSHNLEDITYKFWK